MVSLACRPMVSCVGEDSYWVPWKECKPSAVDSLHMPSDERELGKIDYFVTTARTPSTFVTGLRWPGLVCGTTN